MATNPDDILGMSDEDISNLPGPPAVAQEAAAGSDADPAGSDTGNADNDDGLTEAESAAQADDGAEENDADDGDAGTDAGADGTAADAAPADAGEAKPEVKIEDLDDAAILAQGKPPVAADPAGDKKPETEAVTDPKAAEKAGDKSEEAAAVTAVAVTPEAATAFYNQVMAPFKANGKTIELKSPEEVISLMQMGANYTRKMQDIQPHRKVLTMLQNNDLLDEGKLSFLIDLDKKDPAAIQKLIKESGIDPLDIDVTTEPSYSPGGHQVSDEEISFRTAMDDLKSNASGIQTISTIHDTWDDASKEQLWKEPAIMSAIHEQRESGVYDLITTEMDRQRTLGTLPANLSFIEAYKTVGNAMVAEASGAKSEPETPPVGEVTPPAVVTRAAVPKRVLANGEKAAAASPTRSSPKAAKVIVNPLAMSDEDFEKLPRV